MNWTNRRFYREQEREEEAFYAEAQPCEGCGLPVYGRALDAASGLRVGECCAVFPDEPICEILYPMLTAAETVAEVSRVIQEHRQTCEQCYEYAVKRHLVPPRKKAPGREGVAPERRREAA